MVGRKPALHTLLTTETKDPRPQVNWTLLLPGGTRNLQAADLGTDLLVRKTSATVCVASPIFVNREPPSQSRIVDANNIARARYRQERRVCFLAGVMLTTSVPAVSPVLCHPAPHTSHRCQAMISWLTNLTRAYYYLLTYYT